MRILTNEIYSAHGWAIPCGQYIANKEHGHGRAATRAPSPRPHPLPPLLYTKLSRTASSYSRGERGAERRGGPLWSPVSSEWLRDYDTQFVLECFLEEVGFFIGVFEFGVEVGEGANFEGDCPGCIVT